jgi:AAA15 family ATPase/GTPase
MLLSFRFENFRSFKEEQELSMVAAAGKEKAEVLIRSRSTFWIAISDINIHSQ